MKHAANALNWCVGEMERRYKLMSWVGVRNLSGYNSKVAEAEKSGNQILAVAASDPRISFIGCAARHSQSGAVSFSSALDRPAAPASARKPNLWWTCARNRSSGVAAASKPSLSIWCIPVAVHIFNTDDGFCNRMQESCCIRLQCKPIFYEAAEKAVIPAEFAGLSGRTE